MKARIFLVVLLVLLTPLAFARSPIFTQTIPTITTNLSGNVIQGCSPTIAFPGNVVLGANGTILVTCSNQVPVIFLNSNSTPTFTLTTGYTRIAVVYHDPTANVNTCSFHFHNFLSGGINGQVLTSGSQVSVFPVQVQNQLLIAGYDYCIEYQNAPAIGLTGFGVTWT